MSARRVGDVAVVVVTWTTRRDALRLLATMLRAWRLIVPHLWPGEERARKARLRAVRASILRWSGVGDCARVEREVCADMTTVRSALAKALPKAKWTQETAGHLFDALSSGYWCAHDEDTELYQWDGGAWRMTRERGAEVSE